MNKFLLGTAVLGLISTISTAANAIDSYDQAYSSCSEKADKAGSAYEETFTSCMKEKGFTEHEDGESSPYSTGESSEPQQETKAQQKPDRK